MSKGARAMGNERERDKFIETLCFQPEHVLKNFSAVISYGGFHWESGSAESAPKVTISLSKVVSRSRDLSFPRSYLLARALPFEDASLERSVFELIPLPPWNSP